MVQTILSLVAPFLTGELRDPAETAPDPTAELIKEKEGPGMASEPFY